MTHPISIAVLALPHVFGTSLSLSLDILHVAQALSPSPTPLWHVQVLSWDGGVVLTGAGMSVPVSGDFSQSRDAEVIIVPGMGLWEREALCDALTHNPQMQAIEAMRIAHANGATLFASCSSVFLIAATGLLDQVSATTSWWLADLFEELFPHVDLQPDRALIQQQRIVTAGAALAHADLMLNVVENLAGSALSQATAQGLLIERKTMQPAYLLSTVITQRNPLLAKATQWVHANMSQGASVAGLAQALNTSVRTLARRTKELTGQSPLEFICALRVQRAVHLLKTSTMTYDEIAQQVGYTDASSLRRLLHRCMQRTPGQLRAPNW